MQQRSLVVAVFAALAVNVSVACSGSTTADDNAVPANEFWARYAAAICDGVKPCCENEGFAYDAAACKALFTKDPKIDLSLPSVGYDPVAGADCIASARKFAERCDGSGFEDAERQCNAIVTGTLPVGSQCSRPWECQPTAGREAYCAAGVCQLLGEQGDPCDSPNSCASDLYCGAAGSCVLRLADGEACGESRECQSTKCHDGTCYTPTVASAFLCAGG